MERKKKTTHLYLRLKEWADCACARQFVSDNGVFVVSLELVVSSAMLALVGIFCFCNPLFYELML